MRLIDSHCHLESFHRDGQLAATLDEAAAAGVERLVTIGTQPEDWALYRGLAAAHPGRIAWTAGLHPGDVEADWRDCLGRLEEALAATPAPVALGEIGLDFFRLPKDPAEASAIVERQQAAFAAQLELARERDMSVVVHSRGAFAECVAGIDASGLDWRRVVFHCFVDGPEAIGQLNERGGRGSFTGIATYKKSGGIRAAAVAQGLERLMVETDAPYLAPEPNRGKPNRPAWVALVAERLAAAFDVPASELAARATANTEAFFGLG